MNRSCVLVLDTETNGLPADEEAPAHQVSNWPRLIEIAWQVLDERWDVLRERSLIVYPSDFQVTREAEQVHGISQGQAEEEGISIELVLSVLAEDVTRFSPVLAGHNVAFDVRTTRAEYMRLGDHDPLAQSTQLCTMETAVKKVLKQGQKYPKLDELYEMLFGEERDERHRALADVRTTARILGKLVDRGHAKLPPRGRSLVLDVDAPSESRVRRAVKRYVSDLHRLPVYYDPRGTDYLQSEALMRSVQNRLSSNYSPGVAKYYSVPYDAVSDRDALALAYEDMIAKYVLSMELEAATGIVLSQDRYSSDGIERAIQKRAREGQPVATCVDIRQYYASVDYDCLLRAMADLVSVGVEHPIMQALRGSLEVSYHAYGEVRTRSQGLSIAMPPETFLAEAFLERIEQDLAVRELSFVRVSDEFYLFSENLNQAREHFSVARRVLNRYNIAVLTRVEGSSRSVRTNRLHRSVAPIRPLWQQPSRDFLLRLVATS